MIREDETRVNGDEANGDGSNEFNLGDNDIPEGVRLAQELLNALVTRIAAAGWHIDDLIVSQALHDIETKTGVKRRDLKTSLKNQLKPNKGKPQEQVKTAGPVAPELTEEEKTAVEALANAPDIYEKHREIFGLLGYRGRSDSMDSALNSSVARLLPHSSGFIDFGESGSGKDALQDAEEKLLPPEVIISTTSLSENAINYLGDISHSILKMGELPPPVPGVDDTPAWSYFRQLISANKLERITTVKRGDGRGFKNEKYTTKGPVSIWATTTRVSQEFSDEVANRVSWRPTDESPETTGAVNAIQAASAAAPYLVPKEKIEAECRIWQQYQRELAPYDVLIPYAGSVSLNPEHITARRLMPLTLDYIKTSALIHQATRHISLKRSLHLQQPAFPFLALTQK